MKKMVLSLLTLFLTTTPALAIFLSLLNQDVAYKIYNDSKEVAERNARGDITRQIMYKIPDSSTLTEFDFHFYRGYSKPGEKRPLTIADIKYITPDEYSETVEYTDYHYDSNGKTLMQINYSGAGENQQWFTLDDEIKSYLTYEYDDDLQIIVCFNSAGEDEKWFTPDDEIQQYSRIDQSKEFNNSLSYSKPGKDNLWFTEDDVLSDYEGRYQNFILPDGTDISAIIYHPGRDEKWLTGDDLVEYYYKFIIKNESYFHATYTHPGPDSLWFTVDDLMQSYTYSEEHENRIISTDYSGAGPDQKWFTGDDIISSRFYATGTWENGTFLSYSSPGPDGNWETPPDDAYYLVRQYFELRKESLETRYFSNGHDHIWGTSDDEIRRYEVMRESAIDKQEIHYTVSHPGEDGAWFTDDDEIEYLNITGYR